MNKKNFNIELVEEIIMAYATGDFSSRLEISDELNEFDIISSGINMLGEELEEKAISKDFVIKILNSIPQIVVVFDASGQIEMLNKMAHNFFVKDQVFESLSIQYILPKEIYRNLKIIDKQKSFDKNFQVKIHSDKNQQNEIYLLCSLNKISNINKDTYLFIAKDITNEKEEEKKIIKATLIGQEQERKRLAHDLHDALGQELNAIKMYLNAIELMDVRSNQFNESLIEIHNMLDDSIDSIRNITYNLTPNMLENNDLCSCLDAICKKLIKNIHVNFEYPAKLIHLENKNIELFIYRIFQEFIHNTIKHAGANQISFKIKDNSKLKKYIFHLEDNGIGFNFKKIQKGNGIYNIKNRLDTLNFQYQFKSKENKGTTLIFEVPY